MKTSRFEFTTESTLQELADQFKQFSNGLYGGAAKLAGGLRRVFGQMPNAQGVEFFTPRQGDDPFENLNSDKPSFSVGVTIPKASGMGGGNVVLQMYIWDRGSHREGQVVTPYTSGAAGASRSALDQFAKTLKEAGSAVRT